MKKVGQSDFSKKCCTLFFLSLMRPKKKPTLFRIILEQPFRIGYFWFWKYFKKIIFFLYESLWCHFWVFFLAIICNCFTLGTKKSNYICGTKKSNQELACFGKLFKNQKSYRNTSKTTTKQKIYFHATNVKKSFKRKFNLLGTKSPAKLQREWKSNLPYLSKILLPAREYFKRGIWDGYTVKRLLQWNL